MSGRSRKEKKKGLASSRVRWKCAINFRSRISSSEDSLDLSTLPAGVSCETF